MQSESEVNAYLISCVRKLVLTSASPSTSTNSHLDPGAILNPGWIHYKSEIRIPRCERLNYPQSLMNNYQCCI